MNRCNHSPRRAQNVGIVGLEAYFPSAYVSQSDLETYDGVSPGKYTVGLGQTEMGVCSDLEDVYSIALTVTKRLMDRYNLSAGQIGRIEVGTESSLDRSKSVKTFLMQLFANEQFTDFAGVDVTNACFGGTQALFNAVDWVESGHWDGRYAVVVAADIAVYEEGAARCTGGAGAIAMLVGDNAPLVFHHLVRSFHMDHVYDFYKPDRGTEYPLIDGQLSIQSYFTALDRCYALFCQKYAKAFETCAHVAVFDGILFHSPYSKLVQKSFARLLYADMIRGLATAQSNCSEVKVGTSVAAFDNDKLVEKVMLSVSSDSFASKTEKSLSISKRVGNMYAASLYAALVSHLKMTPFESLPSQKLLLFSYGSGLAACMFSVEIRSDEDSSASLRRMLTALDESIERLEHRVKVSPELFSSMLAARQSQLTSVPSEPTSSVDLLFPGTFYIHRIDDRYRRYYKLKEQ